MLLLSGREDIPLPASIHYHPDTENGKRHVDQVGWYSEQNGLPPHVHRIRIDTQGDMVEYWSEDQNESILDMEFYYRFCHRVPRDTRPSPFEYQI